MKDRELLERAHSLRREIDGDDEAAARAALAAYARLLSDHPHIRQKIAAAKQAGASKLRDERTEQRRAEYEAYIQSVEWQRRREVAIRKAGERCQVCNQGGGLHVHHRTYVRFGAEMEDDLTVLCDRCHRLFYEHGRLRGVA